jgi:hypothetical protein
MIAAQKLKTTNWLGICDFGIESLGWRQNAADLEERMEGGVISSLLQDCCSCFRRRPGRGLKVAIVTEPIAKNLCAMSCPVLELQLQ